MANSAADARASEQEIRQKLIESRAVDVMVAVGPKMFYTVTLPYMLWFFDKAKSGRAVLPRRPDQNGPRSNSALPDRSETVLFKDARQIYRQVDRAHREWTPAQMGFLANLVRLHGGEAPDYTLGGDEARTKLEEVFGPVGRASAQAAGKSLNSQPSTLNYRDIPGLCKAASIQDIAAQGWSLNRGRYARCPQSNRGEACAPPPPVSLS